MSNMAYLYRTSMIMNIIILDISDVKSIIGFDSGTD